ncbi:MAG: HAD family hydrolase [Deltaproteobacteria bacterium]|nr:HAD family hydrolase [Deltaproteobacteria bacterium]
MKRYRAVLFDLFGTVALFRQEKLPLFEWNGKSSRSTMGKLRAVVEQKVPQVPFAQFMMAHTEVSRELGEVRSREMREFPSIHRFALILARVGLSESAQTQQIAQELSLAHMQLLADATDVPASHSQLLADTRRQYRVALVSNFDHGATARHILQRDDVTDCFEHIVISDEHGWRKPHPLIFTDTLATLGVEPQDALFVGDSPHDDIRGAVGVGMDVAWVNEHEIPLPGDLPTPQYVVRAIPELRDILLSEV